MRVDMPPEDELCLLLARAQLSPQSRERALSLLAGPLQWPRVFERARTFGVFPLLYTGLHTLGFPGVPDHVRSEWANIFRFNAIWSELLARELARILRLLGDAGIPVMPLKGVALAESLYGAPALRVSGDIDVLVPPRHAIEAFHLVVSSGYKPEFTEPRLLDLVVRYAFHGVLMREERTRVYQLELHWALFSGGGLESELLEQVWADAARKTFYGVPAFALSAEWEFLYLAVHAGQDSGLSLKWFADLDRLCSRGILDWKKVNDKAKSLGWDQAVRSSLAACGSLFETPIAPVFGLTAPPHLSRALLSPPLSMPTDDLFNLRLLRTRGRKLRFLAHRLLIPTPAECRLLPLPSALFFVYYLLRPLRVACVAVRWFIQAGMEMLSRMLRQGGPGGP